MKFYKLVFTSCCLFVLITIGQVSNAQQITKAPFCLGEVHHLQSEILQEKRTFNIYISNTYDPKKKYDVFYLLDGSTDEDFIHITGLMQFFSMMYKMPDYILVGIANVDRKRDFSFPTTVVAEKEKYPTTGGSEKFIQFIEQELQPYIKSNFSIKDNRYLLGQSLGGLLAAEILLSHTQLFSHYIIVSPSLWWNNHSLLNEAKKLIEGSFKMPTLVHISVGADEPKDMVVSAKRFYKLLKKHKKTGNELSYYKVPNENHATVLHQAMYEAFKTLFESKYE